MTVFDHLPDSPLRRPARGLPAIAAVALAAVILVRGLALGPASLPERLTDDEFWGMVTAFSESGGTFPSKNYVSNEIDFQSVIPALRASVAPGSVYLGVGPDQNFTYIAALRPGMAFIVDIRRANLMHHLLYKALFELSPDRAMFLERLFSRPRLPDDPVFDDAGDMLDATRARAPSEAAYLQNLREVLDQLRQVNGFPLSPDDRQDLDSIYSAFFLHGPQITYAPLPVAPGAWFGPETPFPSYADLMTMADGDGANWSYLATEERYAQVRDMQMRNLIVPIVGDFAGPKALRAVGDWVRAREATVTAVYTSNVEQYLFQNNVWREYYDNVATLPVDGTSTFIRSYFPSPYLRGSAQVVMAPDGRRILVPPPQLRGGVRFVESSTLLDPVLGLLEAVESRQIHQYRDVIERSR